MEFLRIICELAVKKFKRSEKDHRVGHLHSYSCRKADEHASTHVPGLSDTIQNAIVESIRPCYHLLRAKRVRTNCVCRINLLVEGRLFRHVSCHAALGQV